MSKKRKKKLIKMTYVEGVSVLYTHVTIYSLIYSIVEGELECDPTLIRIEGKTGCYKKPIICYTGQLIS